MITVIGLDGGALSDRARTALAGAACVAGAPRHLASVPVPPGAPLIEIGNLDAALARISAQSGPVVVLASGDPGFFGIVRALRRRGIAVDVVPSLSSVARAFALLGLPWDDAVVLSAHGREPRAALATALAHPKAAILTAPGPAEPSYFAPHLLAAGRELRIVQRLGGPDEAVLRVSRPQDAEAALDPNVLISVDPERAVRPHKTAMAGHAGAPRGWGLAEDDFEHRDGMITKAEVRAVALAHLAPRPGTVVWDIGAGSGSVAIECARFGAHAVAFEKNPEDRTRIRANALRHGVEFSVGVAAGEVPACLGDGEERLGPDAVFFGGAGDAAIAAVLDRCAPNRVVVALASLDRVRPVRELLTGRGYAAAGTQVQASRLAELPNGSLRLAAANPVTLVWAMTDTETRER